MALLRRSDRANSVVSREDSKNMTTISARKAAKNKRSTHRKRAPKTQPQKKRSRQQHQQDAGSRSETAPQTTGGFQDAQVPDPMRALAEQSVAQTRAAYEHSKGALRSVLESWQRSFDAVGQGAVEFNRKMIDVADRRIASNFDLARRFAKAKNVGEFITIQQDYWRSTFSDLNAQAEDVRAQSSRLLATATGRAAGGRRASPRGRHKE